MAHVAVELGDRRRGIDAGLARHHRHVGGVRQDDRPLHQSAPGSGIDERGELVDQVGEFVAALPAPDVHDDVGVTPLGELLEQHRLSLAEPADHGRGRPPGDRREHVEHTLPGVERLDIALSSRGRAGVADRPLRRRPDVAPVDDCDHLTRSVLSRRRQPLERPTDVLWHHDAVLDAAYGREQPDYIAGGDAIAHRSGRMEVVACCGRPSQRPRSEEVVSVRERPKKAVIDPAEQAGTQLDGERMAGGVSRLPDPERSAVLIQLSGGLVAPNADDLARQPIVADLDVLEAGHVGQSGEVDDRAADACHRAGGSVHRHSFDTSSEWASTAMPARASRP